MEEIQDICGCKGIRTCLVCESKVRSSDETCSPFNLQAKTFWYCIECGKAWTDKHPHCEESMEFPGISIQENFISAEEETFLMQEIDKIPWKVSQSGRRKQDFGPKVNFKKKKVKATVFSGLPFFSQDIVERMNSCDNLKDFIPVEQCQLEYTPDRGSSIDPHFDDFWLWGERLVTVNLLSDTYLTMTKDVCPDIQVMVPLLKNSLIVVSGPARYEWKHGIRRQDVRARRLAMTYRELSDEFLREGCRSNEGKELIDVALTYKGVVV